MPGVRDPRRGCMAAIGALAVLAAPASAQAQAPRDFPEGTKVRITAPPILPKPTVGTVAGWPSDSLVLQATWGGHRTVSRTSVTRFDVSRGRSSKVVLGTLIGLGVGIGAGVVVATGFCDDPDSVCDPSSVVLLTMVVALPFTAVGAGIGLLIRVDRWEEIPVSQLSSAEYHPRRVSLGIALRR